MRTISCAYTLVNMSGTAAKLGDVYNVAAFATLDRDPKTILRRVVCIAELPYDEYIWRAMARTTTAQDSSVDMFSPKGTYNDLVDLLACSLGGGAGQGPNYDSFQVVRLLAHLMGDTAGMRHDRSPQGEARTAGVD